MTSSSHTASLFSHSRFASPVLAEQAAISCRLVDGIPVGEEVVAVIVVVAVIGVVMIHQKNAGRRPRGPRLAGTGAADEREKVGSAIDKRHDLFLQGG